MSFSSGKQICFLEAWNLKMMVSKSDSFCYHFQLKQVKLSHSGHVISFSRGKNPNGCLGSGKKSPPKSPDHSGSGIKRYLPRCAVSLPTVYHKNQPNWCRLIYQSNGSGHGSHGHSEILFGRQATVQLNAIRAKTKTATAKDVEASVFFCFGFGTFERSSVEGKTAVFWEFDLCAAKTSIYI